APCPAPRAVLLPGFGREVGSRPVPELPHLDRPAHPGLLLRRRNVHVHPAALRAAIVGRTLGSPYGPEHLAALLARKHGTTSRATHTPRQTPQGPATCGAHPGTVGSTGGRSP